MRARNIGVRKLVHDHHLRTPRQYGLGVHLLKLAAAIPNLFPGNNLEPFGLCDGVLPAMRLEVADNHVNALGLQLLRLLQHLVGLADACRVPHENLESAASHSTAGRSSRPSQSSARSAC